jgi:hypothetical protein
VQLPPGARCIQMVCSLLVARGPPLELNFVGFATLIEVHHRVYDSKMSEFEAHGLRLLVFGAFITDITLTSAQYI